MAKSIRQLRKEAMNISPAVQIGKKGLTEESIKEIKRQLKEKSLVKVKLLKASMESISRKDIAERIANDTGSKLVNLVGFVATFFKEKPGKNRGGLR